MKTPRMQVSFRDRDLGFKGLVKLAFGFRQASVAVGVTEADGAKSEGALTVLDVANIHEFGLGTAPERSFLRAYFDQNEPRIQKMLIALMEAALKGKYTKEQILEILGQKMVGEIQARISAGIEPPLAQATIDKKGSSTPLIDTGQLRASISYKASLE